MTAQESVKCPLCEEGNKPKSVRVIDATNNSYRLVDDTPLIYSEIERLERKRYTEGLTPEEYESLYEYKGRAQSIEAERDYLNGEGR